MLRTNDKSHAGPQLDERARRELETPMASLQGRLEAMHPGTERGGYE